LTSGFQELNFKYEVWEGEIAFNLARIGDLMVVVFQYYPSSLINFGSYVFIPQLLATKKFKI